MSIPRTSRRLAVTQAVIVVFVAVFATSALAATPTASNAPGALLGNSAPSWWINDYLGTSAKFTSDAPSNAVLPVVFSFPITFAASDHNSGLSPSLMSWRLPDWHGDAWFSEWHAVHSGDTVWFDVRGGAVDDGVYTLEEKVADKAGNEASKSTPVMIDTRPPTTDGPSGWINGLVPYQLTATDQALGAGVAATAYRVDMATPWTINATLSPATTLVTSLPVWPAVQGAFHTIDFGSVDAALPADYDPTSTVFAGTPSYMWGNFEGQTWVWGQQQSAVRVLTGYKTRTVQLDVTAPVVTASDFVGAWQAGPVSVNFSGTDVGSGYAFTEWSTDGVNWTQGETARFSGDGPFTVRYRGVDNVGIRSEIKTTTVLVATTKPTVAAKNATVKRGHKAKIKFNVTAVTPRASVNILVRKKGQTYLLKRYSGVGTNKWAARSFRVNLPKGTYLIRVDAVDLAGNAQTTRGAAKLIVK